MPVPRQNASVLRAALAVAVAGAVGACGGGERGGQPERGATPTATATAAATAAPEGASGGGAPAGGRPRTHGAVVRALAGRHVRVGGHRYAIDAGTLACGGLGRPVRRIGGEPAWTRFRCVQPTFPPGQVVGPDVVFVVRATHDGFAVAGAHLTHY